MQVINGTLKNYAWGIPGGLLSWLPTAQAESTPAGESTPQAELWFGAHPNGASKIVDSDLTLGQVLDRTEVPLLVKILAVAKPLSVQVHPNLELAREGFNRLNNTERFVAAFADPDEKIELLYALTPFTAFCGWRPLEQVLHILRALSLDLPEGLSASAGHSRRVLFEHFVGHSVTPETLRAIPSAIRDAGFSALDIHAYETVAADYPEDQGALLAVFLQPIALEPGGSVYIPAGIPHSYISGTGIEVMTSSDNVLRLGLTPKPVYAELALRALDFESELPSSTLAPFSVEVLVTGPALTAEADLPTGQFRLILCLEGTVKIRDTTLAPGQAAVLTVTDPSVSISTNGRCAVVRTRL